MIHGISSIDPYDPMVSPYMVMFCRGACLVGAQDLHRGDLFQRCEMRHDAALVGHLLPLRGLRGTKSHQLFGDQKLSAFFWNMEIFHWRSIRYVIWSWKNIMRSEWCKNEEYLYTYIYNLCVCNSTLLWGYIYIYIYLNKKKHWHVDWPW